MTGTFPNSREGKRNALVLGVKMPKWGSLRAEYTVIPLFLMPPENSQAQLSQYFP